MTNEEIDLLWRGTETQGERVIMTGQTNSKCERCGAITDKPYEHVCSSELEKAAGEYATIFYRSPEGEKRSLYPSEAKKETFLAGALWQKEHFIEKVLPGLILTIRDCDLHLYKNPEGFFELATRHKFNLAEIQKKAREM